MHVSDSCITTFGKLWAFRKREPYLIEFNLPTLVTNSPRRHTIFSPAYARKVIAVRTVTHLNNSIPSGDPYHIAKYSAKGPSKLLTVKPDVALGGDVSISKLENL